MNNFLISNALTDNLEHSQIIKNIDMLYVLHWVQNSFEDISSDVISNCWRKTGIFPYTEVEVDFDCEDDEVERSSESSMESIDKFINIKEEKPEALMLSGEDMLKSFRKTIEFLRIDKSKFLKESLDLHDKILDEYKEKHLKGKLDFFFYNNKKND